MTNGPFRFDVLEARESNRAQRQSKLFPRQAGYRAKSPCSWSMKKPPRWRCSNRAIWISWTITASRPSTNRACRRLPGYKLVPQLRGEYYGFAVDRKPFDNPQTAQSFRHGHRPRASFPKSFRAVKRRRPLGFRRACWRTIPRSVSPFNPSEARAAFERSRLSRMAKDCRRLFWATTHKMITSWWPKRSRACGKRYLNVIVSIENQEWKVYLKKLQNDPFVVHRAGWGADYPDPDNFMKLFTSNSGNNHGRWKNPRYDQLLEHAAREQRRAKRSAALRRSTKNSYRNRRRYRAAVLESRSNVAESQIYRLGI